MAVITIGDDIGMDVSSGKTANQISIIAGSYILKGHALCVNSSGELALADIVDEVGSQCSKFVGLAPKIYLDEDQTAAAYGAGAIFKDYSSGLTAGEYLYVSGSAGLLETVSGSIAITSASSTTFDSPVALCISTTDILIVR